MSAWDDASRDLSDVIRADGLCPFCGHSPHGGIACAVVVDDPARPASYHLCVCSYPSPDIFSTLTPPLGPVDFWWRQVGTDIEIRVQPDFLSGGPPWQHQHAPTGLLTVHLEPAPIDAELSDPLLDPIETPGPTLIRQAEWDDATQSWMAPDPVDIEIPPDD